MKPKKVIKELKKQLRKDKDNLALRLKLAGVYQEAGQIDAAIDQYYGVALAYFDRGRLAQAHVICQSALDLAPAHAEAKALRVKVEQALRLDAKKTQIDDAAAQGKWVPSLAAPQPKSAVLPSAGGKPRGKVSSMKAGKAGPGQPRERDPSHTQPMDQPPSSERLSEPLLTPTPLPAPLAPHDADEDSVVMSSLHRYKLPIKHELSGPVPVMSLPGELAPVAEDAADYSDQRAGAALGDDDDDDEPTQLADPRRQGDRDKRFAGADQEAGAGADSEDSPRAVSDTEKMPELEPGAPEPWDEDTTNTQAEPGALAEGTPDEGLEPSSDGLPVPVDMDNDLTVRLPAEALNKPYVPNPDAAVVAQPAADRTSGPAAQPRGAAGFQDPLAVFGGFPDAALDNLAARMTLREFAANQYIVREDERADACFALVSGQVIICKRDSLAADQKASQKARELARLEGGAFFGELALQVSRRRPASVRAVEDCRVYEIPRLLLRELAASYDEVGPLLDQVYRERLLASLMQVCPFLCDLPEPRQHEVLPRIQARRYVSGERIVEEGRAGGGLYLVLTGALEVTRRVSPQRAELMATLEEGSYVGEMALLRGDMARATVSAVGPTELGVLSPEAFCDVAQESPRLWRQIRERGRHRELAQSELLTGEVVLV